MAKEAVIGPSLKICMMLECALYDEMLNELDVTVLRCLVERRTTYLTIS